VDEGVSEKNPQRPLLIPGGGGGKRGSGEARKSLPRITGKLWPERTAGKAPPKRQGGGEQGGQLWRTLLGPQKKRGKGLEKRPMVGKVLRPKGMPIRGEDLCGGKKKNFLGGKADFVKRYRGIYLGESPPGLEELSLRRGRGEKIRPKRGMKGPTEGGRKEKSHQKEAPLKSPRPKTGVLPQGGKDRGLARGDPPNQISLEYQKSRDF